MRELLIRPNEAGQRLDKFLHKYMKEAPSSFFYKMMRKKNIVLNGAKCTGQEILQTKDSVKLFFSEETFVKFGAPDLLKEESSKEDPLVKTAQKAYAAYGNLEVIYEDEHILAVNKPSGILTQKSQPSDLSLNEWLIGYLLKTNAVTDEDLHTFHPSVCNRLDRNTSGLVLCAKSLSGAQFLTEVLKNRSVHKYYRLFVKGTPKETILTGWLNKDEKTNKVSITDHRPEKSEHAVEIKTGIAPIRQYHINGGQRITYAQAELFTGKSHQIRAHFAHMGHCLLGDEKYGDPALNKKLRLLGIRGQMLHAYQIVFPEKIEGTFSYLSKKVLTAKEPDTYPKLEKYCTDPQKPKGD